MGTLLKRRPLMPPQVSKQHFAEALIELGHDPAEYSGKKLSLEGFAALYEMESEVILDAIDRQHLQAHYDYQHDTVSVFFRLVDA